LYIGLSGCWIDERREFMSALGERVTIAWICFGRGLLLVTME
jgi:hypothetical protein